MDYEKAYKEALERASHIKNNNTIASPQEVAEYLFPELRESEDERIRKELINYHTLLAEKFQHDDMDRHKVWLAYLEKQKELPFVKDVILGYPGLYFYDGERMHFRGNPAMEEKQKDQKPAEWSEEDEKILAELVDALGEKTSPNVCAWLKSLRPTWKPSEEDEKIRRNLMSLLANMRGYMIKEETYQKYYSWLKSLRPQEKEEKK